MLPIGSNIPEFMFPVQPAPATKDLGNADTHTTATLPLHTAIAPPPPLCIPSDPSILMPSDASEKFVLVQTTSPGTPTMSLLFDTAYQAAKAAECRCHGGQPEQCECTNVIIYRYSKENEEEEDSQSSFPLPCRRIARPTNATAIHPVLRAIADQNNNNQRSEDDDNAWEPNILRRIEIVHLSSSSQLMRELLCVPDRPVHRQPYRAIMIEGLHQFADGESPDPYSKSSTMLKIRTLSCVVQYMRVCILSHFYIG